MNTRDANIDESNARRVTSMPSYGRSSPMDVLLTILITAILSMGTWVPLCVAQQDVPPQTVKGDLLTITGETYVVRDISGVLRHLRVDKDTKRDRLIVPGEKVEVQISPDGHALSIKPIH